MNELRAPRQLVQDALLLPAGQTLLLPPPGDGIVTAQLDELQGRAEGSLVQTRPLLPRLRNT